MSDSRRPPRLRLRHAAVAAAAALGVLWPLGQVLHFHGDELQALQAERAALDPLTLAVQVQRGLIGHDLVSARVLAGRTALEPERRLRQADVDSAIWRLKGTLSAGLWTLALRESTSLEQDWHQLARRVALRQLSGPDSRASHHLLVEQVLQVMDLVQAATAPSPGPWLAPMLAAASLPAPTDETAARAQMVALEALQHRLQAQAQRLDDRLQRTQTARDHQALGLALLGVWGALGMLLMWARAARRDDVGPEGTALDSVRRGYGRRTTDTTPRDDEAQRLMQALRQRETPSAAMPPDAPN
jgi:hypothetical protein